MKKISKNCYKGELITNPFDIKRLAIERKSVYLNGGIGLRPAAWFLCLQLSFVLDMIERKQLFFVVRSSEIHHTVDTTYKIDTTPLVIE
jgi:hypothetical protein